jgi:exopolysaccharide biosynthesis polyprenyl glycosylphosphotransferase
MLQEHSARLRVLLQATDVLLAAGVFGAVLLTPSMRMVDVAAGETSSLWALALISAAAWPIGLQSLGTYRSQRLMRLGEVVSHTALAGVLATGMHFVAAFLLSAPVAPYFPLACGLAQLLALCGLRLGIHGILRWLRRDGRNYRNVLIVGSGPRAAYIQKVISWNPGWGLSVMGFIDDGVPPDGPAVIAHQVFKLRDMAEILNDQVVDEVIVACPRSMLEKIIGVVDACALAGVPITLLSDLFGDYLPAPRSTRFGSLPALSFAPVHHHLGKLVVKRAGDILGASVGLVVAAPILALAAMAIRLTSSGPAFFRQVRCGLNGRQFVMHKLRTMYVDAEDRKHALLEDNEMDGPVFKMKRDPRITPIGFWLRRFSIDELPQIWDVLRGQMSLVGPRPSLPIEVAEYQTFERRRLSMRPGLTCLWQVSGRNEIGFDDWVRLDLEYIDTWSLRNDLKILLRTIPTVLGGSGS